MSSSIQENGVLETRVQMHKLKNMFYFSVTNMTRLVFPEISLQQITIIHYEMPYEHDGINVSTKRMPSDYTFKFQLGPLYAQTGIRIAIKWSP